MTRYRFPAKITDVFERKLQKYEHGFGNEAVFTTQNAGWYVRINDQFSIYVGTEPPSFDKGDEIVIQLSRKDKV